tara:strand:- start:915 stop:2063 length:1149 start_codon:yes stop_codon:yes gene_type:complete
LEAPGARKGPWKWPVNNPSIHASNAVASDVADTPEMVWLDALEAEGSGDRVGALEAAKRVVEMDPKHTDGWMGVARWSLPPESKGRQQMPDLAQAAKSIAALRKVVALDPEPFDPWKLGGVLLVDHLGMMEQGLDWWQQRREFAPYEVAPIIEQIGILVRMGLYDECANLLEQLYSEGMEATTSDQLTQMEAVNKMVSRAAKMEEDEIFKPQNPKHPRWRIIENMKKRKPISPTFFLITFVAPIVFILGTFAMTLLGGTTWGFLVVFVFILACFMVITRLASGMLHRMNRHALDLDRAIDYETTSGKICIPEEIRYSKLYNAMVANRVPALNERLELIVEGGDKIPIRWKLELPEFTELNTVEDSEDSEEWWSDSEMEPLDD